MEIAVYSSIYSSSLLSLHHPFPQRIYYERALPWAIACTAVEYHIQKTYLISYENVIGGRRMGILR